MPNLPPTREEERPAEPGADRHRAPGLVRVFGAGAPALDAFPLVDRRIAIGRADARGVAVGDDLVSQRHAEVSFDGTHWTVRDLGSRNGTFVDGEQVSTRVAQSPRVLRVGQTLLLFSDDVRRFAARRVERRGGAVVGPTLAEALRGVELAARTGETLLVTGESGTGKELAARAFHAASPFGSGPFVAVNCAAIPEGIAERLLFGASKGAYSGATAAAEGYLVAADGGTLFLDELGELDAGVQAKLLRAIETREVLPLGASRPRSVAWKLCVATNVDLRQAVAAGRFRADLYFRVARPEVHLPPLRDRPEEIPWLVADALARASGKLAPQARFVEACLLRSWPGNVRELLAEVARAGHVALAAGRNSVETADLAETAGVEAKGRVVPRAPSREAPDRDEVEQAIAREGGNVSGAARALGLHRNQLRRLMEKLGIKRS